MLFEPFAHRKKKCFDIFDIDILIRAVSTGPCHIGLITTFCFSGSETDLNSKIWDASKGKSGKKCEEESDVQIKLVGGPGESGWCCYSGCTDFRGSLIGLFYNVAFPKGVAILLEALLISNSSFFSTSFSVCVL